MRVLAAMLGRSSAKLSAHVLSASALIGESASLFVYDPELSKNEASLSVPAVFDEGWLAIGEHPVLPEEIKNCLRKVLEMGDFSAVIFNDSPLSFWVAPLLAGELRLPIITEVIGARKEENKIIVIRPLNQESVWGEYEILSDRFVLIIRRGSLFPKPSELKKMFLEEMKIEKIGGKTEAISWSETDGSKLEDAPIVIGIGDGVRQSNTLKEALELAKILGAEYCCTKPVVESGIMERERIVGMSGKRISPKLYMALGISGSAYHLAGVMSSEIILSINLDRNSSMNKNSDYYYVGDLRTVLPRLIELFRQMPSSPP
ncbi:MAG: electron transfer flavoprotein subunit alpha/FixB family protein [Fervidicoccaceae archaeon]